MPAFHVMFSGYLMLLNTSVHNQKEPVAFQFYKKTRCQWLATSVVPITKSSMTLDDGIVVHATTVASCPTVATVFVCCMSLRTLLRTTSITFYALLVVSRSLYYVSSRLSSRSIMTHKKSFSRGPTNANPIHDLSIRSNPQRGM